MFERIPPPAGIFTVAPGRQVEGANGVEHGPGDTVALDLADVARLIAGGYILDANGQRVLNIEGPPTTVENGSPVEHIA